MAWARGYSDDIRLLASGHEAQAVDGEIDGEISGTLRRVRKVLEIRDLSAGAKNGETRWNIEIPTGLYGAPEMIRTSDARFRKPTLYPLSYGGVTRRREKACAVRSIIMHRMIGSQ